MTLLNSLAEEMTKVIRHMVNVEVQSVCSDYARVYMRPDRIECLIEKIDEVQRKLDLLEEEMNRLKKRKARRK